MVGNEIAPGFEPAEIESSLADLEWGSLAVGEGTVPPPAAALPLEVHHAFAGLQFLREHLWAGQAGAFGMAWFGGRVWAFRSGVAAEVEQLTGAPARVRWHEWEGGAPLAWCELGAAEVWRLSCARGTSALHAHYRPALAVSPDPAPGLDDAPFARPAVPALPAAAAPPSEGRRARRKRKRREAAAPAEPPPAELTPEAFEFLSPLPPPVPAREPVPAGEPAPAPSAPARPPVLHVVPRPPVPPAPEPASHPVSRPASRPASRPPGRPTSPPRRVSPRFAWPKPSTPVLVGAACALVVAAVAGLALGRKPLTTLVVGRYTVDVASQPAGAAVRVDGHDVPGRTPLTLELAPGEHRVDLAYGEYASASFELDGARGDHVHRAVTWSGSLGVASADTTVRLAVAFDGQPWGTTPLWRDTVPVGRHRLSFRAAGVRAWDEEVQVHAGQSTRVNAEPVHVPPYGLVTARAELVSTDGVEDLEQLPVFVDGERVGVTPVDLKLTPGPHSVRIARGEDAPSVHLIDVQAGGRYYATSQFGRPPDPVVQLEVPARLSRARSAPLVIRLGAELPLPVRQMSLWVKRAGGAFDRVAADVSVVNGRAVGTVAFPLAGIDPAARALTWYVEVETREGEEYFSEVHTTPLVP